MALEADQNFFAPELAVSHMSRRLQVEPSIIGTPEMGGTGQFFVCIESEHRSRMRIDFYYSNCRNMKT